MDTTGIIELISSIKNRANELIVNELKKEGIPDIVPSHGNILFTLFKKDGIMMKEINEIINKKKNTVTVLIKKLIKLGYIKKQSDPTDQRITRIFLTEKGKSFEKSFFRISNKLVGKIYINFTDEEKNSIMKLLNKVKNNLG